MQTRPRNLGEIAVAGIIRNVAFEEMDRAPARDEGSDQPAPEGRVTVAPA
jgi:hypothetical protein